MSWLILSVKSFDSLYLGVVGPCHHDMVRPQVADRETVSDMEGSCE
jgi:hypothetical protein